MNGVYDLRLVALSVAIASIVCGPESPGGFHWVAPCSSVDDFAIDCNFIARHVAQITKYRSQRELGFGNRHIDSVLSPRTSDDMATLPDNGHRAYAVSA